ncbi:MAG: hypothetical protein ACQEXQ_08930 [Bacillota bacterium]
MTWRKRLIALLSLLSIGAGCFYLAGIGFDYSFLGMEGGSERDSVQFWGNISTGLGLTLLVTVLIRKKMKEEINDGLIIFILSLLFLIQLPPFALWLLVAILGNMGAIAGVAAHSLLILVIVRIVTLGRRGGSLQI